MIFGVYWYKLFPKGLYSFEYFQYKPGVGGHGDIPAELGVSVTCSDVRRLIERLKRLCEIFKDSSLTISRQGDVLQLRFTNYMFFDYDFLLAKQIDNILIEEQAMFASTEEPNSKEIIFYERVKPNNTYPSNEYFIQVHSDLDAYNAHAVSLRLDCNIESQAKTSFIEKLSKVTEDLQIETLYYFHKEIAGKTNLMVFLTNGRQGLNLKPKKETNVRLLEEQTKYLFETFEISKGHLGGYDSFPYHFKKPTIIRAAGW